MPGVSSEIIEEITSHINRRGGELAAWCVGTALRLSLRTVSGSRTARDWHSPVLESHEREDNDDDLKQQVETMRTLAQVAATAKKDPDKAQEQIADIRDPGTRARALAALARSMLESDHNRAGSLLREAEALVEKIKGIPDRVEAQTDIAEVWGTARDVKRASALIAAGFSSAMDLYSEEADAKNEEYAPLISPAATLMTRLAMVDGALDPVQAARRTASIGKARVRALLELVVAWSILNPN